MSIKLYKTLKSAFSIHFAFSFFLRRVKASRGMQAFGGKEEKEEGTDLGQELCIFPASCERTVFLRADRRTILQSSIRKPVSRPEERDGLTCFATLVETRRL